ncbi:MAG: GHMP family kinase ATP-binding protein [bacterium]
MIISRTPHRISFFGGGTDYPDWYLEYGGKVLGAAIDKYCYISLRELPPFFEHKYRIIYSKIETINSLDEILHPSVRETLKYFQNTLRYFTDDIGFEVHHDGDIPARSGMGSSSSFTVGLVNTLYAFAGKVISKDNLFKEAIHIEQNLIKENVGSQDQVWASVGGLNLIEFLQNGKIVVKPIIMKEKQLNTFGKKFMLFFTGLSRYASEVAGEQIKNLHERKEELFRMTELVDDAYKILTSEKDDFSDFGKLLNETWFLKRKLSDKVTNTDIDSIYETAIKNGAVGGKLLGAGAGGFILFYVEPENQGKVKEALKNLIQVPFNFDFAGSEIIVYKPNHYL